MARPTIAAPTWELYAQAAQHSNASALAEAELRKQEATLPAIWRIGATTYVTTGAHWFAGRNPVSLNAYVVEPAAAHEQDNRTPREPDTFYRGRVFRCGGQRWKMIRSVQLLPPEGEPPEQLEQQAFF